MTRGPYRRLSGILRLNGRSPMLETTEQMLIRLQTDEDLSQFSDLNVIVEGSFDGPTLLDLTWIAEDQK